MSGIGDRKVATDPNAAVVLVVDDNVDLCSDICFEFDELGFKTFSAHNGSAALKIIDEQKRIDVIISDIRMPNRSGISLFESIKREGVINPVFILMTGYSYTLPNKDIYQGVDGYFTKPFSYATLTAKVLEALKARKGDKETAA